MPQQPTCTTRFEVDGPQGSDLHPTSFIDQAKTSADSFTEVGHIYLEEDVCGRLLAGVWACNPTTIRSASFPFTEFVSVVEGVAELTGESGHSEIYQAGDFFMIRAGMSLTWHVPENLKLCFVAFIPQTTTNVQSIVRTIRFEVDGPALHPTSLIDPAHVTAGTPNEEGHIYFDEEFRGKLVAGTWRCGPTTTSHTSFPSTEFVYVVEGVEEITDACGHKEVYEAGDYFVVPAGMPMTWHTPGAFKQFFVALFPA